MGGIARVVFESHFPQFIERNLLSAAELPALLQAGTIVTVVAKIVAGPLSSMLGPYKIGWLSLLATGTIVLLCGLNVLPVFAAWCLMRACQSATWPASNSLIDAWFDTNQHGRAWGIMSTSSRSGIMFVTSVLALSGSTSVANNLIACGIGGIILSMVIALYLEEEPADRGSTTTPTPTTTRTPTPTLAPTPTPTSTTTTATKTVDDNHTSLWTEIVQSTVQQPTFYLAVLIQATVTPIAEFQSQLPIWLSSNNSTPSFVNQGVASWHLGVLSSVLVAGVLFDKSSPLQRGFLLGLPILFNSFLFYTTVTFQDTVMEVPALQLLISFLLGASYAPANYLMMTTWAMRYATRRAMPIASASVDVCGYIGTVILLQLQSNTSATNPTHTLMHYLSIAGFICALASMFLFSIEARYAGAKSVTITDVNGVAENVTEKQKKQ